MTRLSPFASGKRPIVLLALVSILSLLLTGCTGAFQAAGWSALSAADSTLYIGTGNGRVAAMEKQDGKIIWTFPVNFKDKNTRRPAAIYAAPVVSKDRVYVADHAGTIFALNRSNGQEVWTYCLRTQQIGPCIPTSPSGVVGDIVLTADGTLLVPSSDAHLYALDTREETGSSRLKWSFAAADKIWSSPSVADNVVYFGSLDHMVYAVSLQNGKEIWKFATNGSIVGQPLVANGTVYIGGFDSTLYALDAKTGSKRWEHKADSWFWIGPATDGQSIYAGTLGGRVMALDPQTGKTRWDVQAGKKIVAPITVLQKSLIVPTDDNYFRVFSAANGHEDWPYPLEAGVRTRPVVSGDGIVYVTNVKGQVRALNALRGTALWGPAMLPES
ncbi:MAG: hypothetical protein EXR67_02510 [Dehalococcoidia bacterium]|nr:hypothetical protein [Dehalococcoidia bacterium]